MVTKQELKNYFKTGAIPTGEHFAEFIDAFVAYVNEYKPDAEGRVTTGYNIIEERLFSDPPSAYPEGVTEFAAEYDKSKYTQYIADNPSYDQLENGKVGVRTINMVTENVCYQQIDNVPDGHFVAAFYRVMEANGNWGELVKVSANGDSVKLTDNYRLGDKTMATSSKGTKDMFDLISHVINDEAVRLNMHEATRGTQATVGHVKMSDDYNLGQTDTATSTKGTKDLHATLNTIANTIGENLVSHISTHATATNLGHVKIGETLAIETSGVLNTNASQNVTQLACSVHASGVDLNLGDNIKFDLAPINSHSYDAVNGTVLLKKGFVYRVNFSLCVDFSSANDYMLADIIDDKGNNVSHTTFFFPQSIAEVGMRNADLILKPNSDIRIALNISGVHGNARLNHQGTLLNIQTLGV